MEVSDERMDSKDCKAHVVTKMEPPTVLHTFAKMEEIEAVETFDFHKGKEVEPFVKAEPFGLPKTEKSERFEKTEPLDSCKIETTKPHDFSKAKTVQLSGFPLIGSTFRDEKRDGLLMQLSRIRDFIMLLLNYSMRTVHDSKLKDWVHEASNRRNSLDDLNRLLNQNPLKCFQGLLQMSILENVERDWHPIFAYSSGIPEDIVSLSVNLAVDQLIQTLLCEDDHVCNIHHVLFSTRDAAEKRLVKEKIEVVLKDKDIMLRLHGTFTRVLLIDASDYQSQAAEVHIRRQIAQQLCLPGIHGDDDLLLTSIEKEVSRRKYLVLLVDGEAKQPLDPRKVGFPEELAGAVVCITTESSKQANSQLTMAMDLNISTNDHLLPWEVFCEHIGTRIFSSAYIERMAVRIVKECGDHLLASAIVAKSLRNAEYVSQWEHALEKLRWLHPSYDIGMFQGQSSVMLKVFINILWHDLSKTQKYCLTSCLFVSGFGKLQNELINDWISSKLVGPEEAMHNLRELVDRSALLQLGDTKSRYIQIPQDTYAILQLLNTHNPLFMKRSELGLVEPPDSEKWHSAIYIDLASNKLSELPSSPICRELKVLKLHNNADLTKIPPFFFFEMPLLCVLDLSCTSVRELPYSFFGLEQLRELHMKSCECFMKLSSEVGRLKNLEKIDLDKTQITHLPKEIQELTNLQSLTLCLYEYRGKKSKAYTSSTIIPSGVISKLTGLKHLSIDVSPDDERWEENLKVILPEFMVLKCLQTISLYIPALELLNLMPWSIFELDFKFIVGRHMSRIISGTLPTAEEKFKQSERSLKFVKGVDVPYEISFAVRHSKALYLDRHMTIKDLSKFGMKSIEQVRVCILAECKEMQTIVDGRCSKSWDILPRLLVLSVSYMKNLRSIYEGEVHSSLSFGMLKTLALHNCPMLTTVFTLGFLGNLSLLKEVVVKDCPKISALISCGPSELRAGTFLPKLRTMMLLHLPELICISNGLHMGPRLENIGIYDCPKLQRLSKMELSSQNLKVIKGETKWWEALIWSEAEWGIVGWPSSFDCIFSPIDNQADIMSELEFDEDIDDSAGGILGKPLQPSSGKTSEDMRRNKETWTEYNITTRLTVDEPLRLRPSSDEVFKEKNHPRHRAPPTWRTQCQALDDGYSWRKYGQKDILGAIFPRDYLRCTYRNTQGCQATKEVQRDDEKPFLYNITYRGRHTCWQTSIVTNSSSNNQVDLSTQSLIECLNTPASLDDDDIHYHPESTALRPSSLSIITDQKQIGSSRSASLGIQAPEEAPKLQLSFKDRLSLPIFTGSRIQDINGSPIQVVLVDKSGHRRVPTSVPYPMRLEVVVLDGEFPRADMQEWTSEEFNSHIMKARAGRRPLLAGELNMTMRNGIACLGGDLEFTDNSYWVRSRKFRVAVRVVPDTNQGPRVLEALTESFVVKDHRGELYRKHHPPMLEDEVWRLEKIGKDGAFHRKLASNGINNVQEFLKLSVVDPTRLRQILGVGMSDRMWEITLKHARSCKMENKLYVYRGPQFAVFLNPICQLVRADINGHILHGRDLNNMNRSYLEKLVREAYARWDTLEEAAPDEGLLNINDNHVSLQTTAHGIEESMHEDVGEAVEQIAESHSDLFGNQKATQVVGSYGGSEWNPNPNPNPTYDGTLQPNAANFAFILSESPSDHGDRNDNITSSASLIHGPPSWP